MSEERPDLMAMAGASMGRAIVEAQDSWLLYGYALSDLQHPERKFEKWQKKQTKAEAKGFRQWMLGNELKAAKWKGRVEFYERRSASLVKAVEAYAKDHPAPPGPYNAFIEAAKLTLEQGAAMKLPKFARWNAADFAPKPPLEHEGGE